MTSPTAIPNLDKNIDALIRGDGTEFDAYLAEIVSKISVPETNSSIHCYVLKLDGNKRPRVKDLAQAVALRMIDYCIPRSEINRAKLEDERLNQSVEITKLKIAAKSLFTNIKNTGEGGEILLYMLTQAFLRLPQFLCKMPLKTSSQMHYHGADGVHIKYDSGTGNLALYWGESKLHANIEESMSACFDSIMPFLVDEGGSSSAQFRDLKLITSNLDVCDDDLKHALLRYLNPDDPLFNQLEYRGVCLVGFNEEAYPETPNSKALELVIDEIKDKYFAWMEMVKRRLRNRRPLDTFELEIFLLPFPSVNEFRKAFLEELNYV